MNRRSILLRTKKFLESQNVTNCFELIVDQNEFDGRPVDKRRTVYILGLNHNQNNELAEFLQNSGINAVNGENLVFYENIGLLGEENEPIPLSDNSIENTWRGRILRFGEHFDFNDNVEAVETNFLKSYFRLIITRVGTEYFGKHDISPTLYHPGSNTAGFEDFKYAIDGILKFLYRGVGERWCPADPHFDYVKTFISLGMNEAYIPVDTLGQNEILVNDLFQEIMHANGGVEQVSQQIYNALAGHF